MKKIIFAAVAAATILTGCWIPEKFDASIDFKSNGGYTIAFDGTLHHGMMLQAKQDGGSKLPKDADKFLQAEVDQLTRKKGVITAKRVGDTKIEFKATHTAAQFQAGQPFDAIFIRREPEGIYSVKALAANERDRQAMKKMGLKLDGSLKIKLPSNATVVETNATTKPGVLSSAYKWDIDANTPAPVLRFKLN